MIFKLFGIAGLLLITAGVFMRNRREQDWLFIFGGLGLLVYSSYLRDPIFIVLQVVFTVASIYALHKEKSWWERFFGK